MNRLKTVLPNLISTVQPAFVPKHLITDNVLLAFELNRFLNTRRKTKDNYMTLKLDISKAYDQVEWSFLRNILLHLGLHHFFCGAYYELCNLCDFFFSDEWFPVWFFTAWQGTEIGEPALSVPVHFYSGGFYRFDSSGGEERSYLRCEGGTPSSKSSTATNLPLSLVERLISKSELRSRQFWEL